MAVRTLREEEGGEKTLSKKKRCPPEGKQMAEEIS